MAAPSRSGVFVYFTLLASLLLVRALPAPAQETQPQSASEKRVADLRTQILETSAEIDQGVEEILDLIIPLRDTVETGNKVTQLKQQSIESLKKAIDFYVLQRQKLEGELARPVSGLTKEQMATQVSVLDEKVDDRINDILRISASLAESKDVEKYEYSYNYDTDVSNRRVTDEYRLNRKVQSRVVDTKGKLDEALKRSIQTLKQRVDRYERLLPYQVSEENRSAVSSLIAETRARITEREQQLAGLADNSEGAGERPIGNAELKVITQLIDDQKAEIRASFDLMRRLKGEYDAALSRLNYQR